MPKNLMVSKTKSWLILLMIACLLTACTAGFDVRSLLTGTATAQPVAIQTNPSTPFAEVVFRVEIPQGTPAGQRIYLNILDEVTGLALNPLRYAMDIEDATHYQVRIPIPIGSVVKYRYTREGSPQPVEYTASGKQVRYRMFSVDGPSRVNDKVSAWNDLAFDGTVGRITGYVVNTTNNLGIPNILITAAGASTLTASDGSFILEGVPTGVHQVVAYSLDGSYRVFQQGAVVAEYSTTPVEIELVPAALVEVTFVVHPPADSIERIPIRMVGNITNLGNTFADLEGGISTVSSRAPALTPVENNLYVIKMMLPEGMDLRYKYTLGDGFWNAEHSGDINFRLRQLIVPSSNITVDDYIDYWKSGTAAPISFTVTVPENTPAGETISIQFNPYGWTSPIPMWPLGNNQWMYILFSPMDILGSVSYRVCRNDQCGSADDIATAGINFNGGQVFSASQNIQKLEYQVQAWVNYPEKTETPYSPDVVVNVRPDFFAGIELAPAYSPNWQGYYGQVLDEVALTGANKILLTPTWRFTNNNLPVLEPVMGVDPSWADLMQITSWVKLRSPELVIFPQSEYAIPAGDWWDTATRDAGWWTSWFDRYRRFILHHADLAEQSGASAIILGEEGMQPALPGGVLADGTPSGAPPETEDYWRGLVADVRNHFSGTIIWAVPYGGDALAVPEFLDDVDMVYLLWNAPLTGATVDGNDMTTEFSRILDEIVQPAVNEFSKPIIIGLNYPSVDGASSGCVSFDGECISFDALSQPDPITPEGALDLQEQADIYHAALVSINDRPWVAGIVSRGYYAPVPLIDQSSSIRQKPAEVIINYWFDSILANQIP